MPFTDIRNKVLGGDIKLIKKALWVDRWGEWVMIQELPGDQRAALIEANTNTKTGKVNIKTLYPHMAILSARYPDAECEPEDIEVTEEVDGEEVTLLKPHPHIAHYPSLEDRQSDSRAGMLIFGKSDDPTKPDLAVRDSLNTTSGAALEQIGQIAGVLSGLAPEDIAEKKGN